MPIVEIGRATRSHTPIIIALAGPSKSGKTYSALRLATGMASGGEILMLNTEGKRGRQYADRFAYLIADLAPPFSSERYTQAIEELVERKPAVLIVDSLSHEHEGEGGLIDYHETEMDRIAGAGADFKRREACTWAAWVKPKAANARLCSLLDRLDCNLIVCFRAQEKTKPPPKGQREPIQLGWQAIGSPRLSYLTDASLILPPGSRGKPDMSAMGSDLREPFDTLIQDGVQIDEALGKRLAAWASGAPDDVEVRLKACASLEALRQAWEALTDQQRLKHVAVKNERYRELKHPATQQKGGEAIAGPVGADHTNGPDAKSAGSQEQDAGRPTVSLAILRERMGKAMKRADRDLLDAEAALIELLPQDDQAEAWLVYKECKATIEEAA